MHLKFLASFFPVRAPQKRKPQQPEGFLGVGGRGAPG